MELIIIGVILLIHSIIGYFQLEKINASILSLRNDDIVFTFEEEGEFPDSLPYLGDDDETQDNT